MIALVGRVIIIATLIVLVFGLGHWAELALNLESVH